MTNLCDVGHAAAGTCRMTLKPHLQRNPIVIESVAQMLMHKNH